MNPKLKRILKELGLVALAVVAFIGILLLGAALSIFLHGHAALFLIGLMVIIGVTWRVNKK